MPASTWHTPIAHTTGLQAPASPLTPCHLVHIRGWDPGVLVEAQLVIQSWGDPAPSHLALEVPAAVI